MSKLDTLDMQIMFYDYFDKYKHSISKLEDKAEDLKDIIDDIVEKLIEEDGMVE